MLFDVSVGLLLLLLGAGQLAARRRSVGHKFCMNTTLIDYPVCSTAPYGEQVPLSDNTVPTYSTPVCACCLQYTLRCRSSRRSVW